MTTKSYASFSHILADLYKQIAGSTVEILKELGSYLSIQYAGIKNFQLRHGDTSH